jgi:hypothetical protein
MTGTRKPSRNEAHEREKAGKRRWYHRNQAKVRAQQARYNERRNAWKYGEQAKRLFQNLCRSIDGAGLSVISELELRCPSYRRGDKWERWLPMISLTGKVQGLAPGVVSDLNTLLSGKPDVVSDEDAAEINKQISDIGVKHGLGPTALHARGIRFVQKSDPHTDENLGHL